MVDLKDCLFSVKKCQGVPVYFSLYDKKADNKLSSWALVLVYNPKQADLVFIHTPVSRRGYGYAEVLLRGVCGRFDELYTQYDASTEEGRKLCLKVGMKREKVKDRDLLVWRKEKVDEDAENRKV